MSVTNSHRWLDAPAGRHASVNVATTMQMIAATLLRDLSNVVAVTVKLLCVSRTRIPLSIHERVRLVLKEANSSTAASQRGNIFSEISSLWCMAHVAPNVYCEKCQTVSAGMTLASRNY